MCCIISDNRTPFAANTRKILYGKLHNRSTNVIELDGENVVLSKELSILLMPTVGFRHNEVLHSVYQSRTGTST